MALFEEIITPKRLVVDPLDTREASLDSFMKVLVGLGNPGKEYNNTRHNIGFACLDDFAKNNDFDRWQKNDRFKAEINDKFDGGQKLVLAKPQTFMNLSGESLQAIRHFYKCHVSDFIIIHDELDLSFGTIRVRQGGSDAGHNGLKSVNKELGQDYWHIRIGVGPTPEHQDAADFVLGKFSAAEQKQIPKIITETNRILQSFINGKPETQTITI